MMRRDFITLLGGAAIPVSLTALGMTLEGQMPIEGPWVDRVNGLESVQVDIVMMRTPDGHGRLELTKFRNPKLVAIEPAIAPPNTLGLRSVMFTVESVDDTVARLRANGAELVGEVAQYEDMYRLCYMRGPAGIIVALITGRVSDSVRLRAAELGILFSELGPPPWNWKFAPCCPQVLAAAWSVLMRVEFLVPEWLERRLYESAGAITTPTEPFAEQMVRRALADRVVAERVRRGLLRGLRSTASPTTSLSPGA